MGPRRRSKAGEAAGLGWTGLLLCQVSRCSLCVACLKQSAICQCLGLRCSAGRLPGAGCQAALQPTRAPGEAGEAVSSAGPFCCELYLHGQHAIRAFNKVVCTPASPDVFCSTRTRLCQ